MPVTVSKKILGQAPVYIKLVGWWWKREKSKTCSMVRHLHDALQSGLF